MPQRSGSQAPEPRGSSAAGASTNSAGSPGGGSGGGGSAAKQRLRWTPELHERFVDAVTQLGGPDSAFFLPVHHTFALNEVSLDVSSWMHECMEASRMHPLVKCCSVC